MPLFWILILIIVGFALMEAPLFTVIGALSIVCFYFIDQDWQALQSIIIEMNRLASMPVLASLPLFTFCGCLLSKTGMPSRTMNFIHALMGRIPGGLAIAGLCACAFFTALTGASGVTIVALGSILYPILRKKEYGEKFSLGLVTTSGSLGLLFPPSLPIILYGVVSRINITDIFRAAALPGVIMILVLSVFVLLRQFLGNTGAGTNKGREKFSIQKVKNTFFEAIWDWPILLILVFGVYGGFVTIAEVSAVILCYVVVVESLILKEVNLTKDLPEIMIESAILSGAIIMILGMAMGFTGFLVEAQVPNRILEALTSLTQNKYVFLLGINLFLLAVGCIMDIFSAIVIVVPIIAPIALRYGIDPVHLCVIFLINLEIGYSTPPVGMNLFIAGLKFQKPVTLLYRANIPFLLILFILLLLVTYVPGLSLFLLE